MKRRAMMRGVGSACVLAVVGWFYFAASPVALPVEDKSVENKSADAKAEATKKLKIFSGEARLVIVHGYSTSFRWPNILQQKLDRYSKGKRIIEVRKATKGGTPIAKWMDVKTAQRSAAWKKILTPAIKAKGDRPAIVLAQQSLQWAFGDRRAGITGKDDKKRIKRGADILQHYVKNMIEDGANLVFIAMHIYKKPMEPQIGNERLALAELVKRKAKSPQLGRFFAGPDVWAPTKKLYPGAFARDKVHPNDIGAQVMAQLWFETLLKHDGLEAPKWSRQQMQEAIKKAQQAN